MIFIILLEQRDVLKIPFPAHTCVPLSTTISNCSSFLSFCVQQLLIKITAGVFSFSKFQFSFEYILYFRLQHSILPVRLLIKNKCKRSTIWSSSSSIHNKAIYIRHLHSHIYMSFLNEILHRQPFPIISANPPTLLYNCTTWLQQSVLPVMSRKSLRRPTGA